MIDRIATLFARLGGLMIMLIAVAVAVDVFTRNIFGRTVLNSFEISAYLFAIAISFGLSYTALSGAHIRVDVLLPRLPVVLRRALDFAAFLSMAAMGLFLAWHGGLRAIESLERGVVSASAAAVPLGVPQAIWAAGFLMFALTSCLLAARHAACLIARDGHAADRIGRFGADEEAAEAIDDARQMEA
ncbi:TRAP transporter small permease [Cereibacter sp. SYSU M97828]|nr:TRAP transporter small permease [Cereibacter flavus]